MDQNDEFEEIEELDENPTTEEEIPEEYSDENYEESYDNSYNRPKFGEREYKNAKDENGHHDKDYYKKRGQELDEKVDNAKEEKGKNWKKKEPDEDGSNTERKNRRDKIKDNINLEKAKYDRWQNKLDGIKAKTYQTLHPVEAAKEEAKEKAKDAAKATGKAAVKGAAKAAKATGRLVAAGGKAVISFLASNPIALAVIGVIAILFIILGLLFAHPSDEDLEPGGYFDTTCDFNLTSVEFNVCGSSTVKTMGLKEYVLSVAYGESQEYDFSEPAIKALMIIVKTNVLANGHYNSSGNKVVKADDCNVIYDNVYEELADENENKIKKDKVKLLEQYYNEIESFLYISESFAQELTDLDTDSALEYSDDIIEQLAETNKNGYEEILNDIYNSKNENSDEENVVSSKPTIFVGDSRTVGMDNVVTDLKTTDVVAKESVGYVWFASGESNSGANLVSNKAKSEPHNIVIWLGVNDLYMEEAYFNKYKELAEGDWSKHTIYIVSVGPLNNDNDSLVQEFNEKMFRDIKNANISNLRYIDLGLTKENMDWDGCNDGVHYGNAAYNKIYNQIVSHFNKNLSKTKALFNNSEYCSYYRYRSGCEVGWWWPIGEAGNFNRGAILSGDPQFASIGGGPDWGWRLHPKLNYYKWHDGEDIAASHGMNVIASRGGTIVTAVDGVPDNSGSGCGNYISIDHGDGYYSRYCHLKYGSVRKYVSVGMQVSQGQIIAQADNTGISTGDHLHFEIRYGTLYGGHDTTRNPLDYISTDNPRPAGHCNGNYSNDLTGICQALKDQGLTDIAVAALLGNISVETAGTYDPGINAPDGENGRSWGIVMWHNTSSCSAYDICTQPNVTGQFCNANAMKCYCKQNNMEWDTTACQVQYLMKQINEKSYYSDVLKGNYDVQNMANLFCTRFEVANDCFNGRWSSERTSRASNLLPFVKNGCKD